MIKEEFSTVNGALNILLSHKTKVLPASSAKIRLQLLKNIMLSAITQLSTPPSLMKILVRHKILHLKKSIKQGVLTSYKKVSELAIQLSFKLCETMVEKGKPFGDGEFI